MHPKTLNHLAVLNCAFPFLRHTVYKQRPLHLAGPGSKAGIVAFYSWHFFGPIFPLLVYRRTYLFLVVSVSDHHSTIFHGLRVNKSLYTLKPFRFLGSFILECSCRKCFLLERLWITFQTRNCLIWNTFLPVLKDTGIINALIIRTIFIKSALDPQEPEGMREKASTSVSVIRSSAPLWTRQEGRFQQTASESL